jgi:hypothetical protein
MCIENQEVETTFLQKQRGENKLLLCDRKECLEVAHLRSRNLHTADYVKNIVALYTV